MASAGNVIPFPDKLKVRTQALREGDAGVVQTVALMGKLVPGREGALHPALRQLAIEIVRGTPARDDYAQACAVFHYVKQHIEFRGEYDEWLQTPLVTAQLGAGDCDDQSMLVAALLMSLGIRSTFITVATGPDRQFSHVYSAAFIRDKNNWLPLDTTVDRSFPGWQPERVTRIKTYAGMGDPDAQAQRIVDVANGLEQTFERGVNAVRNQNQNASNVAAQYQATPGGGEVAVQASPTAWVVGGVGVALLLGMMFKRGR